MIIEDHPLPGGAVKGRLVRITGQMLGMWNAVKGQAEQIKANSIIFIDISAVDPYPSAPSRIWHPQLGKCWYIHSEYNNYEWLENDDDTKETSNTGHEG